MKKSLCILPHQDHQGQSRIIEEERASYDDYSMVLNTERKFAWIYFAEYCKAAKQENDRER